MKVYKLTNKYRSRGMAIIIANNKKECIEVMNNHWCGEDAIVKEWYENDTVITELPLTYTGAQTESFVLTEEWYHSE